MRVSEKAIEIATEVVANIEGRAADNGISLPFIAAMVEAGPDGNHVDIGSLFGASAIAAALMKKHLGHKGKVYCIDPYDDEERKANVVGTGLAAPDKLLCGSAKALMTNAKKFDVELELIEERSHPWPAKLETVTFATAYIDGDHYGQAPWNDFENLRGRVTDYIGCDNVEEEYEEVTKMMLKAAGVEDWFIYYKNITFMAIRRILSARSDSTTPFQVLSL